MLLHEAVSTGSTDTMTQTTLQTSASPEHVPLEAGRGKLPGNTPHGILQRTMPTQTHGHVYSDSVYAHTHVEQTTLTLRTSPLYKLLRGQSGNRFSCIPHWHALVPLSSGRYFVKGADGLGLVETLYPSGAYTRHRCWRESWPGQHLPAPKRVCEAIAISLKISLMMSAVLPGSSFWRRGLRSWTFSSWASL